MILFSNGSPLSEGEVIDCKLEVTTPGRTELTLVALGSGKATFDIDIKCAGATVELGGVYLCKGEDRTNIDVNMRHSVGDSISNQLFKGIADGNARVRFGGKIVVAPDAQKTEAYQTNRNLQLSDTAVVETLPQLEIYADDVKCSHGATVGRLNEDELFYMRTRGIPVEEAKLLQQMAFAYEVLSHITNEELRERMQSLVEKRLRGEFAHCKNCSKNCC